MRTSAARFSPSRISDFVAGECGSDLSKIRLSSLGPCVSVSQGGGLGSNCSSCLEAKWCGIPPAKSSSFSCYIGRNWSTAGTSSARARRLQLRSLDGQTSLATFVGEPTTPCDTCSGKGWLVCDFCEGQKVNVQAKNNKIYRRCPSCRTAGVVICPRCKVFKCVSFPDEKDTGMAI